MSMCVHLCLCVCVVLRVDAWMGEWVGVCTLHVLPVTAVFKHPPPPPGSGQPFQIFGLAQIFFRPGGGA